MADKKKTKVKYHYVRVPRSDRWTPEQRRWRLWMHDVDTLLHEMVKNPLHHDTPAEQLIARAEAFADAYHEMQNRRRPPEIDSTEE